MLYKYIHQPRETGIIINITVGFRSLFCCILIQNVRLAGIDHLFKMKSTSPIRIHLNIPEGDYERPTLDLNLTTPLSTAITLTKNRLTTHLHHPSFNSFEHGQRSAARFSTVSSSYALFLKQRDMDKVKKTVSSLNNVSILFDLFLELLKLDLFCLAFT